jgi:hypothetical protein
LMCAHCKIKLTLSDPTNTNQKVLERTHGPKLEGKWSEIKVIQYNVLQEEVILSVSTIGSNSGKKFWAIDSLRQCLQDGKSSSIFTALICYKKNVTKLITNDFFLFQKIVYYLSRKMQHPEIVNIS